MLLPSLLVIAVIAVMSTGNQLPIPLRDYLDQHITNDGFTSTRLVAIGFGIGVGLAITPAKIVLRYLSTLVHELGHAFTAGLLLASPKAIYIHPSSAGLATFQISQNWGRGRHAITASAGYVAPSLASLAAMNAINQGRVMVWAMFSVSVLAFALLLLIRNLWGLFWTSLVIGACYFGYNRLDLELVGSGVAGVAGYLAINSIQDAWSQITITRRSPGSRCDAEQVGVITHIPPWLVATGQWSITMALGYLSARMALSPHWSDITTWVRDLY